MLHLLGKSIPARDRKEIVGARPPPSPQLRSMAVARGAPPDYRASIRSSSSAGLNKLTRGSSKKSLSTVEQD